MHNDLLDILSRKDLPITNEQLINYLNGSMSDAESHDVERIILESDIDNEAMEGLQLLQHKEKLPQYQLELNKKLREKLQQKSSQRQKKKRFETPWLVILTAGLLALLILAWVIILLIQNGNQ